MNAVSVILGENRISQFEATLELMRQLRGLMYTRHERTEFKTKRLLNNTIESYRKAYGITYNVEDKSYLNRAINKIFFLSVEHPVYPGVVYNVDFWNNMLLDITIGTLKSIKSGQMSVPENPMEDPNWAFSGDLMVDPQHIPSAIKAIADAAYGGNVASVQNFYDRFV